MNNFEQVCAHPFGPILLFSRFSYLLCMPEFRKIIKFFELWLEKYNKPLYSTNEPSLKYHRPFVSTGSVGRFWQFFISIQVTVPACHVGDWD